MPDFQTGEPPRAAPTPVAPSVPLDWKTAVMDLIAARTDIIRLELADLRRQSARRAALLFLAVLAAASGWLLLLAGGVPLLASAIGLSWPVTSLILAAIHILLVGVLIALARRSSGPAFTATLSEFKKDREWIENLSKTPKS